MNVISFDLVNVLHLDCHVPTGFFIKLVVSTMVPIALLLSALIIQIVRANVSNTDIQIEGMPFFVAFKFLYFFLPSVSRGLNFSRVVRGRSLTCAAYESNPSTTTAHPPIHPTGTVDQRRFR